MLFILWLAVYNLDIKYYNRLLTGAVNALILLERDSTRGRVTDRIQMSIEIARAVERPEVVNWKTGRRLHFTASPALLTFYRIVALILFFGCLF